MLAAQLAHAAGELEHRVPLPGRLLEERQDEREVAVLAAPGVRPEQLLRSREPGARDGHVEPNRIVHGEEDGDVAGAPLVAGAQVGLVRALLRGERLVVAIRPQQRLAEQQHVVGRRGALEQRSGAFPLIARECLAAGTKGIVGGHAGGSLDESEPDRLARERHPAPLLALRDPELVVEVQQVLLHRRLGDDELRRDLLHRRRLSDHVVGQQRPAECDEDVRLSPGQIRPGHHPIVGLTQR